MAQNVIDKTADYVTETAHQAARATGNIADAIDEGTKVVRRVARQGCDAAEDFMSDTKEFVNDTTKFAHRNLWQSIAVTLVAGILIGWAIKRR
jgi:ElaB/YqjD/DUF883 family membrane-anchored ribosome-binding protein